MGSCLSSKKQPQSSGVIREANAVRTSRSGNNEEPRSGNLVPAPVQQQIPTPPIAPNDKQSTPVTEGARRPRRITQHPIQLSNIGDSSTRRRPTKSLPSIDRPTLRTEATPPLPDILPPKVWLGPIQNKKFYTSGGEAVLWTGTINGTKVIVRDAHPPEEQDWDSLAGEKALKLIRRQVAVHLQLRHANLLPLLGVTNGPEHPLSVVTPFAENGHAIRYLQKLNGSDRPPTFIRIGIAIADALRYLHNRKPPIIHGDIHPRNIVIDANGTPLLCDIAFPGIQHEVTRTDTNAIQGRKYRYIAPELIASTPSQKIHNTPNTDCYAYAMTLLEMATFSKPFTEYDDETSASKAAERGERPRRITFSDHGVNLPKRASDALWELLERMWSVNPERRLEMGHVVLKLERIASLL